MNRSYINTLIAIAVLVALYFSFNAWNKHKGRVMSEQGAAKTAERVVPLDLQHINSFTISSRDGKSLTCTRQGKTWNIVKPLPISADQSKVASFLESLTSATTDEVIAPHPAGLKDFGLDPPEDTIEVSSNSKPQQFTLLLGDSTPTNNGIYAQVAGEPRVFTLSSGAKTDLEKTLFDLRDTRAITLDTSSLESIDGKSGKQSYKLTKNPEGVWEVSLPPDVRADHFGVQGLVDNLQGLTMHSVVSEEKKDEAKYGFGKPVLTLKLATPKGSQTLVVGKKTGQGYYAINSALDPIFTIDQDSLSQLQKSANDFRDKDLFSWDQFDVKRFEATSPKGQWAFEQSKNQWKQAAQAGKSEPSDKVNAFLSALRNLRATSFPSAKPGELAKFGLSSPAYTFKVQFGAKEQTEVVEVGEAGGHDYARRASDPLPSEVSASDLKSIEDALGNLGK